MVAFAAWYYLYFICEVPSSCNLRPAQTWQTSDNPNARVPVAAHAHTLTASACQGPGLSPNIGALPGWRGVSPGAPLFFPKSWAVGSLRLPGPALVLQKGILGLLPWLEAFLTSRFKINKQPPAVQGASGLQEHTRTPTGETRPQIKWDLIRKRSYFSAGWQMSYTSCCCCCWNWSLWGDGARGSCCMGQPSPAGLLWWVRGMSHVSMHGGCRTAKAHHSANTQPCPKLLPAVPETPLSPWRAFSTLGCLL